MNGNFNTAEENALIDHPKMVARLLKTGEEILSEMTPHKAHLDHMALGITGEAGEIADVIKKYTKYNKPLDHGHLIEELGDAEFFLEGIRIAIGVSREEILMANIYKLEKRYHKGTFSNDQAQERADKQ